MHGVSSLPVRECGLKCEGIHHEVPDAAVTSRAGVWIEIYNPAFNAHVSYVTSRAGVWIEIHLAAFLTWVFLVTSRAGVWIEICHNPEFDI